MFKYKTDYKSKRDVLDALKNGVRTDHLKATISYPDGFDSPEKITISMLKDFELTSVPEGGFNAARELRDIIDSEALELKEKIDEITHEIGLFTIFREYEMRRKVS